MASKLLLLVSVSALLLVLTTAASVRMPTPQKGSRTRQVRPGLCQEKDSGTYHFVGDTWKTTDCQTCTCGRRNQITCGPVDCPAVDCDNPVITLADSCCPLCPVCSMGGEVWPEGKYPLPDNFCEGRECLANGELLGWASGCAETNICDNGSYYISVPGKCCRECGSCNRGDTWYLAGRVPDDNPCNLCTCDEESGEITCVNMCRNNANGGNRE